MNFFYDLRTEKLLLEQGGRPISVMEVVSSGKANLRLTFFEGTNIVILPRTGLDINFGLVDPEGNTIALANEWTLDPASSSYRAEINFNTEAAGTALGDAPFIETKAQLFFSAGGKGPFQSQVISTKFVRSVFTEESGTPILLPGAEEWLDQRAIRVDKLVDYTDEQKDNIIANLGDSIIGPPGPKGDKGEEGPEGPIGPPLTAIALADIPDESTPGLPGQHGAFGERLFEKLPGEETGWVEIPSLDEDGKIRTEQFPEVVIVKVREGTTAELAAADPPLQPNEPAFDTTTKRFQMGDTPYAKVGEQAPPIFSGSDPSSVQYPGSTGIGIFNSDLGLAAGNPSSFSELNGRQYASSYDASNNYYSMFFDGEQWVVTDDSDSSIIGTAPDNGSYRPPTSTIAWTPSGFYTSDEGGNPGTPGKPGQIWITGSHDTAKIWMQINSSGPEFYWKRIDNA